MVQKASDSQPAGLDNGTEPLFPRAPRHPRLMRKPWKTRPALNWLQGKPGDRWPIVIAVPVESIEAWLLTTRGILVPGSGSLFVEQEGRGPLKRRMYGRPGARREDVKQIALPLVRQL